MCKIKIYSASIHYSTRWQVNKEKEISWMTLSIQLSRKKHVASEMLSLNSINQFVNSRMTSKSRYARPYQQNASFRFLYNRRIHETNPKRIYADYQFMYIFRGRCIINYSILRFSVLIFSKLKIYKQQIVPFTLHLISFYE